MKWQQFFEIQDGVDRLLEFLKLCISDVIDMFQIEVPMFSQILVTIGQIVNSKLGSKIFIGFSRPRGEKKHFPFRKANGLYNIAMRYRAGL